MPSSLTSAPTAHEAPSDNISSNTTSTATSPSSQKLSDTLPPLVFGTATLNYQFNVDPYALHPNTLISTALTHGIRAFDTSPYYGPAEEILGTALHSPEVTSNPSLLGLTRQDYHILTKAGRIRGDEFDYSPSWLRFSVQRSLKRLRTTYLDVVYLHDVEFVSPGEVLTAIRTLRAIRDESATIRHVGICGYPVATLASLSEMILAETGEPLDIVQSYANYTVQNTRLESDALTRLTGAGVDVVANASPLGMGLLRSQGVPIGAMGNWHPAPDGLRTVCLEVAAWVEREHGEKLEGVAVRFAMESWLDVGKGVGARGVLPSEAVCVLSDRATNKDDTESSTATSIPVTPSSTPSRPRLGVNVMGVSKLSELSDTMSVYASILTSPSPRSQVLATTMRNDILGSKWTDYEWESPGAGFVNSRGEFGVSVGEREEFERDYGREGK